MPDGTSSIIWDTLKYVWMGLVAIITFMWRKLDKKVDNLEKCTIQKDVFNDTLASLREDIKGLGDKQIDLHRTMRADTREDVKGIHQRIDKLMEK